MLTELTKEAIADTIVSNLTETGGTCTAETYADLCDRLAPGVSVNKFKSALYVLEHQSPVRVHTSRPKIDGRHVESRPITVRVV